MNKRVIKEKEGLHKFKKKKLNNMLNNSQHVECIGRLESLITIKNKWELRDVEKLFEILYDNFEVASVYGFQLEKALINLVDSTESQRTVHVSAMCMSRFANINQSNGTVIIQMMIRSFLKHCLQYFDYFESPTNLTDLKLPFPEGRNIFPDCIVNSDGSLWTLINRLEFAIVTIGYINECNYDFTVTWPFDVLVKLSLALLSEAPSTLSRASTHKLRYTVYHLHTIVIKLLSKMCLVVPFRGLWYRYVRSIVDITIGAVSEFCEAGAVLEPLRRDYLSALLQLMNHIVEGDGRLCMSTITTLVRPLIDHVISLIDTASITVTLTILTHILSRNTDSDVNKCVQACSSKLRLLSAWLNMEFEGLTGEEYVTLARALGKIIGRYVLAEKVEEYVSEEEAESIEEDEPCVEEEPLVEEIQCEKEEKVVIEAVDCQMNVDEPTVECLENEMIVEDSGRDAMDEVKEDTTEQIISEKPISIEEMLKSFVPF